MNFLTFFFFKSNFDENLFKLLRFVIWRTSFRKYTLNAIYFVNLWTREAQRKWSGVYITVGESEHPRMVTRPSIYDTLYTREDQKILSEHDYALYVPTCNSPPAHGENIFFNGASPPKTK